MSAHLRCLSPILVVVFPFLLAGCHSGPQGPAVDPGSAAGRVFLSQAGLRGDLNGNGQPDVSDAIGILRIVVALDAFNALADCDGDGSVGVADAIVLLRCVVGLDGWPLGGGSATIGPDGGTVTTVDGNAQVEVPSGALDAETNITVSPQSTWPTAAGVVPGTCYEFGPDGTQFSQPVQLTIAYDESALPTGMTEDDLAIHKVVAGGWELVAGSIVDAGANTVSAQIAGFSAYALRAGGVDATFDDMIGPDGQTLVWVPDGSFMMGSNEYNTTQPVHRVTLDGFWIGQCEVTHEQYAAFLNQLRPVYESLHSWVSRDEAGIWWDTQWNAEAGRYDPVYPVTVAPGYEQHPAVLVTSEGAAAYCAHYVYVLPTEAQWEYAARGPDARTWPWGNLWDAGKCCNINNKGPGGTTFPVGSFAAGASWCGALDMTGNIHEWCADWYDEEYYQVSPELNPQGPDSGTHRVARGGFWNTGESACKAARRGPSYVPAGFRVAGTP